MRVLDISTDVLCKSLATIGRCAERRASVPAGAYVLLRAASGKLRLTVTDGTITATATIGATIADPGAVAVNLTELVAAAAALSGACADIQATDGSAVVSDSVTAAMVSTINTAQFPKVPELSAMPAVKDAAALLEVLTAVARSISSDETRANINGLFIESDGQMMRAVASDGHRLSFVERSIRYPRNRGLLVPRKAICEVVRVAKADSTIAIDHTDTHWFARIDAITYSAKLINAQFPDYEHVIPVQHARVVFVPRKRLCEAVKLALKASGKMRDLALRFAAGECSVIAFDRGGSQDRAVLVAKLPIMTERYDPKTDQQAPVTCALTELRIGIDGRYLLDALATMDKEEVALTLDGPLDPLTVCDGGMVIHVLMPQRLDRPIDWRAIESCDGQPSKSADKSDKPAA